MPSTYPLWVSDSTLRQAAFLISLGPCALAAVRRGSALGVGYEFFGQLGIIGHVVPEEHVLHRGIPFAVFITMNCKIAGQTAH